MSKVKAFIKYLSYLIGVIFTGKFIYDFIKKYPVINKVKIKKWSNAGTHPVLDKPLTDEEINDEIDKLTINSTD